MTRNIFKNGITWEQKPNNMTFNIIQLKKANIFKKKNYMYFDDIHVTQKTKSDINCLKRKHESLINMREGFNSNKIFLTLQAPRIKKDPEL